MGKLSGFIYLHILSFISQSYASNLIYINNQFYHDRYVIFIGHALIKKLPITILDYIQKKAAILSNISYSKIIKLGRIILFLFCIG